jgi:hypothetical protein
VRTIRTEVSIDAQPSRVWDILVDIEGWPAWNPFARASGRLALGERLEVRIKPPKSSPMTFRPWIVKLEPGHELRWLGHLGIPGLFDGEHGFRVTAEPPGRCRFEQFEEFRGVLVTPIMWFAAGPTRAGFEAMNLALKIRAEGAGTADA